MQADVKIPKTFDDVFKSITPTMGAIAAEYGTDGLMKCQAAMIKMINSLNDYFNIGKVMNAQQVAVTAGYIVEDYKKFRFEDIYFCFEKLKKGQYGKIYDRMDGQIIMEALKLYDEERSSYSENVHIYRNALEKKEAEYLLEAPKAIPMPEFFKEAHLSKKKEVKPLEPKKPDPQQVFVNSLISQFDKIYKHRVVMGFENSIGERGKFIRRYGKMLNVDDYLNYKFQQAEDVREYFHQRRLRKIKSYLEFRKQRDERRKSA